MRTTNNNRHANRMATVIFTVFVFGATVSAQSYTSVNAADEAQQRLETLMASAEEAVKYVAQSFETAEFNEAIERLDALASNIETAIRYRTSEEGQGSAVEYAVQDNNEENEADDIWQTLFLTQKDGKYVPVLIR